MTKKAKHPIIGGVVGRHSWSRQKRLKRRSIKERVAAGASLLMSSDPRERGRGALLCSNVADRNTF